jgi:hypothetical protein
MICNASTQSFWLDEIGYTIGIINNNGILGITKALLELGGILPLYFYIEVFFYDVMPFGERFLLLPSIFYVILGTIFLYFTAKKLLNENFAFFAICASSLSTLLILHCGWELRPYALYFCCSALSVNTYLMRLMTEKTSKRITHTIYYSLSVLVLAYTHFFGVLLIIYYGISDIVLVIFKRIRLNTLFLSYTFPALLILAWCGLTLIYTKTSLSFFWPDVPTISDVINCFRFLFSGSKLSFFCFAIASAFCAQMIVACVRHNESSFLAIYFCHTFFAIIWLVGIIFIYSRYINPSGSIFVHRYFIGIVPHILLLTAYGMYLVCTSLIFTAEDSNKVIVAPLIFICVYALSFYDNYRNAYYINLDIRQPYRQSAETLQKIDKVFTNDAIVIIPAYHSYIAYAWVDYYFKKRYFRIPNNIAICFPNIKKHARVYNHAPGLDGAIILVYRNGKRIQSSVMTKHELDQYKYAFVLDYHYPISQPLSTSLLKDFRISGGIPRLLMTYFEKN